MEPVPLSAMATLQGPKQVLHPHHTQLLYLQNRVTSDSPQDRPPGQVRSWLQSTSTRKGISEVPGGLCHQKCGHQSVPHVVATLRP
jgi:hypothetical protein